MAGYTLHRHAECFIEVVLTDFRRETLNEMKSALLDFYRAAGGVAMPYARLLIDVSEMIAPTPYSTHVFASINRDFSVQTSNIRVVVLLRGSLFNTLFTQIVREIELQNRGAIRAVTDRQAALAWLWQNTPDLPR